MITPEYFPTRTELPEAPTWRLCVFWTDRERCHWCREPQRVHVGPEQHCPEWALRELWGL